MVNELEIRTLLRRNDWAALSRVADFLASDHHMSFEEVFGLFERLGGDRPTLEREFLGNGVNE